MPKSFSLPFAMLTAALLFLTKPDSSNAQSVTLTPTSAIQQIVNANPAGTSFILTAGTYTNQSIVPLAGDTFTGQGSVDFDGSVNLNFNAYIVPVPARSRLKHPATNLWVATATPINTQYGTCKAAAPLCSYPQDLFIDGQVQVPVSSLSSLVAGAWYFDRDNGLVYIGQDPTSHTIQLSMLPYAFAGSAANVQISNITVEHYANLAQYGAIGAFPSGPGWVVSNVEVRFTHGVGIKLGSGGTVSNSYIHDNGELGLSLAGTGSRAINNEIAFNNYAGYSLGWEAGGAKFSNTTNLLVQGNYFHDNMGPGIWDDTNNIYTVVTNNTITNNESSGIQHEISFDIVISNNVVGGNGTDPTTWLWNGQISIQNSANAQVYGNTVTVPASNANGIAIINQNRGSGALGPWIAQNNSVYNNTITYVSTSGATGMVNDTGSHPVLGNSFYGNNYILTTGSANNKNWCWFANMSWSSFLATGEEVGGTVTLPGAALLPHLAHR